jgi:hypothetical protein
MNLLNIPTFTNKDLEWIDKQPWFYVEVKRFVMTKTGASDVNSIANAWVSAIDFLFMLTLLTVLIIT